MLDLGNKLPLVLSVFHTQTVEPTRTNEPFLLKQFDGKLQSFI